MIHSEDLAFLKKSISRETALSSRGSGFVAMISGVGSVAILVNDAKKAAEWYHDKLGFEIIENEGHTVFARPRDSQTLLHLCGKCDDWGKDLPGGRTGVWLHCGKVILRRDEQNGRIIPASESSEVEGTYFELKRKGVEFSVELTTTSWGRMAILKDLDGNEFELS